MREISALGGRTLPPEERTLVAGDGANDLPMFYEAGLERVVEGGVPLDGSPGGGLCLS